MSDRKENTHCLKPSTSSASSCLRFSSWRACSPLIASRNWISSSSSARNWFAVIQLHKSDNIWEVGHSSLAGVLRE